MPQAKHLERGSGYSWRVPLMWLALFSLLGGALLWAGRRQEVEQARLVSARAAGVDASRYSSQALPAQRSGKYLTCPISDLPVAVWVLAENPETEGNLGFDYSTVDLRDYRILRLRLPKPDGKFLHVQMLRSLLWMEYENAYRGNVIQLEYPELGIAGRAEVLEVLPCPEIPTRPSAKHCLVTSKFEHDATEVLDVEIAGLPAPIGVTPNHPFWLHDRQQFVKAGELITGETFLLADDKTTHVVAITQRPKPEKVYNLEVDGEHVYYVSASGALVHNACAGQHHFWPKSWGNLIPYGNKTLPMLTATQHTAIHNAFSTFLLKETGKKFLSQSGREWIAELGEAGAKRLLTKFLKQYGETAAGKALAKDHGKTALQIMRQQIKYAKANGYWYWGI